MAATIAHYPRNALAATSKSPSPTNGNLSIYCKHHHRKNCAQKSLFVSSLRYLSLLAVIEFLLATLESAKHAKT
jgi:hypothetical protein